MVRVLNFVKILAVNLLVLSVGLIGVELIWGSWFSSTHALYQFTKPRNIDMTSPNPLGGEPKLVRYVRDGNGFRGLGSPVNKIDIITVGGSTTDQRYLDEDHTYQAVLKRLFAEQGIKIAIANAGIDGQTTIGHVHNFASWFDKIEGLKTRYILYYIGINDVMRIDPRDIPDQTEAETSGLRWQLYIRDKSVFYQLYLVSKRYFSPIGLVHGRSPYIADGAGLVDKPNLNNHSTKDVLTGLSALKSRVIKLNELPNRMGAKAIFVTQRSARWTVVDGKLVGIPRWVEGDESEFKALGDVNGVDIYHIERLIADTVMEACETARAICIDLMKGIQFDLPGDFYDAVHTTRSGSEKIGQFLFRELSGKF